MDKAKIAVFCVGGAANYKAHSLQMTSKAYQLAKEKDAEVIFCYIGSNDPDYFEQVSQCGADKIEFYQNDGEPGIRSHIMCEWGEFLLKKYDFKIALFMAEECGKRVAAILSARFECGLTADCINVTYNDDNPFFYRTALNDAVVAKIRCTNETLQLATIREGIFEEERISKTKAELNVWESSVELKNDHIEVLEKKEKTQPENVCLSKSKIIFGVGRGAAEKNTLLRIEKIAQKCGAELVGTRPVVEEGILPKSRQVGQSGRSIAPDLYVAFGISGVSQHIVGIKKAKVIVAVNKDHDVPIFNFANYAFVGDVNIMLKELEEINFCIWREKC